jgi:hypothetical protein
MNATTQMNVVTRYLLWIGAGFFLFEAVIHAIGLPILEHDKIFLPTHDRYIALFALTYAALLVLIATDVKKYRQLFSLTMCGILLGMINAYWISRSGGYASFGTETLDADLRLLGLFAVAWFAATVWSFYKMWNGVRS